MKDKFDTSTLFPDGTLKREEESPLLRILNQMGGAIFKLKENLLESKKQLTILSEKFEELNRFVREKKF
jgi:hypothetical protein